MRAASARRTASSTQETLASRAASGPESRSASRSELLAKVASRSGVRVENVRRALVRAAGKGFASDLAAAMGWRIERRSRELGGVEKLSLADVVGEIELHLTNGDPAAADSIIAALLEGLRSSTVAITPGSVIRVFDQAGQLFMRFDQ